MFSFNSIEGRKRCSNCSNGDLLAKNDPFGRDIQDIELRKSVLGKDSDNSVMTLLIGLDERLKSVQTVN